MKGNKIYASVMAVSMALACTAFFGSCSSDETALQEGGEGNVLTVSVKPSDATGTRAAATDVSTGTENTVNHFVVGVFDADGNKLGIEKQTTKDATSLTVNAPDYKVGNTVLVAVNTPPTLFDDVTTATDFKNKTLTVAQAIYGNPGHVADNKLADNNYIPMYGEGKLVSAGKSKQYKADVTVYHLVSKVTVNSIKVSFTNTYKGATFQPTEIFLSNVPSTLGLGDASSSTSYTWASNTSFVTGEQTTNGPTGDNTVTASDYPYLSTGELSWSANTSGSDMTYENTTDSKTLPVFYTMPNDLTDAGDNKATFLVIKGTFKYNNQESVCYYPFYLNYNTKDDSAADGGTAKKLSPNYNYVVSITITGKGSTSPTTPVSNSVASINATVQKFSDVDQEYHDVANDVILLSDVKAEHVGKVITSDGHIYDKASDATAAGETAIAMIAYVGSNTGNSTYNHGLAIALKDAGTNNWNSAGSTATSYSVAVPATGTSGWFHGSKDQWTTIMGGTSGYGGTLNTEMTACGGTALSGDYWSATEYSGSNGWYFGSTGWNGYGKSRSYNVRSCLAF